MVSTVEDALQRALDPGDGFQFDTRFFTTEELRELQNQLGVLVVTMVKVGTVIRKMLEHMNNNPNESDTYPNESEIYDSLCTLCNSGTFEPERRLMRMRMKVNVALLHRGKPGYDKLERESFIIIKRVL